MNVKLESVDLEVVKDDGTRCGCCHQPIVKASGVTFGRPGFIVPAINICRRCIGIAMAVVGPEPTTTKEGRC
jgi:hypothetical protein